MNRNKLIGLIILLSLTVILLSGCVSTGIDEVAHYKISVIATTGGKVEVEPNKPTYLKGTKVTITAIPEEGYELQGWEGSLQGNNTSQTVTVENNIEAKAVFANPNATFSLKYSINGKGSLKVEPMKELYKNGESVQITAIPEDGYGFQQWVGDLEGEPNPVTLIMDRNLEFEAVFLPAKELDGIVFADLTLEQVVRDLISKPTGPIYPEDVAEINELIAPVKQINDLGGIEYLQGLTYLDLNYTDVQNIDPLATLVGLTYVDLSKGIGHNKISDITAVRDLDQLTELNLSNNAIQDLEPLYWLGDHNLLTYLDLSSNKIANLSHLETLTNLYQLNLSDNLITDIKPLLKLYYLTELDLSYNQIENIEGVTGFTYLEKLDLSYNVLTDLNDLVWLWDWDTTLRELNLSGNQIVDINYIYGFSNLEVLELQENLINDLAVLEFLTDMRELRLNSNLVVDITNLRYMEYLEELYLHDNYIRDIETLLSLPNLKKVTLQENPNLDFDVGSRTREIIEELISRGVDVTYY